MLLENPEFVPDTAQIPAGPHSPSFDRESRTDLLSHGPGLCRVNGGVCPSAGYSVGVENMNVASPSIRDSWKGAGPDGVNRA